MSIVLDFRNIGLLVNIIVSETAKHFINLSERILTSTIKYLKLIPITGISKLFHIILLLDH